MEKERENERGESFVQSHEQTVYFRVQTGRDGALRGWQKRSWESGGTQGGEEVAKERSRDSSEMEAARHCDLTLRRESGLDKNEGMGEGRGAGSDERCDGGR